MADLGELIGTLLASLAHARRMADEETAAVAEYYKEHPLLQGMSVPRVRVPELSLELPVLIESHEEGVSDTPQDPATISKTLVDVLNASAKEHGVTTTGRGAAATEYRQFREVFTDVLGRQLERMTSGSPSAEAMRFPPEGVARAADEAFMGALRVIQTIRAAAFRQPAAVIAGPSAALAMPPLFTSEQSREIRADLRTAANTVALKEEGSRPRLTASIMTSEVKEQTDPASVARLKIVMKEEGLEWSTSETDDGAVTKTLTPE